MPPLYPQVCVPATTLLGSLSGRHPMDCNADHGRSIGEIIKVSIWRAKAGSTQEAPVMVHAREVLALKFHSGITGRQLLAGTSQHVTCRLNLCDKRNGLAHFPWATGFCAKLQSTELMSASVVA